MIPFVYKIKDIYQENQEVFTLTLDNEANLITPMPGQFNMLSAHGIGESAISFSQIGQHSFNHTIRAVGDVTKALKKLKADDAITLRGPFGQGWPIHHIEDKPLLIIAGGIGLAPLRPVIQHAINTSSDTTLIYGARSEQDMIFVNDLVDWEQHLKIIITVDKPTRNWHHNVGVVTPLIPKALQDPKNTTVLMCGPEVMMRFSLYTLFEQGVPKENIYLSMERHMQCGYGQCGHCQWGPYFICKDGPVMNYPKIESFFHKSEL